MVACLESKAHILPYGRIMIRVFKAFGIDLTPEDEVEEPSPYDTYNGMSMEWMKFEKVVDGSWIHPMDFGAENGHDQHVDDDSDPERNMNDNELNIPPLQTNNSQTYVSSYGHETGLSFQIQ